MATSQEIKISIVSALNAAGIDATKKQIAQMTKTVSSDLKGMTSSSKMHMADFKAGFDLMCSGIKTAWAAVTAGLKSAFSFETQTTQFKTLIGNIDEAKRHMKDLKELGDTPPFSLDQFAAASRQMMVMTDGALGYKKSLEMVGDAAAAAGRPIEDVGKAVARAYSFIRDGAPIMSAVEQLRTMGLVTPGVVLELQDLQAAGASNADIWAEVEAQLGRYNGAMAETEKTGDGLIGAIESRWDNVVRAFGTAFEEASKGGLQSLLDKMKELEQSGTLEVWAAKVAAAIAKVVEAAKTAAEWGSKLVDSFKWVQDKGEALGSYVGTMVGAMSEGASLSEAGAMAGNAYVETERETKDRRREDKEAEEAIRKEAAAKREAAKAAEESARAEQEKSRITKQLAESQRKNLENDGKRKAAEQKLSDSIDKGARAFELNANQKLLSEATKAEADARNEAAKAAAEVVSAEQKLKEAVANYNANLGQNMAQGVLRDYYTKTNFNNTLQNGFGAVMKAIPEIGRKAGENAVNEAAANGKIRSTHDYDKIFNAAAREQRIAAYKDSAKANADDAHALRLSKLSDKALSKADKDWLEKYRKTQESRNKDAAEKAAAEQAKKDAEQNLKDAQNAQIEAAKNIEAIKKKLDALGLK